MSHRRRTVLEKKIQADIEAAIGADPDLLLLRNAVGRAKYMNGEAHEYHVPFGLGVGSPDLVGILRHQTRSHVLGLWLCLEVKAAEGELDPEQIECHRIWRMFGALIYTVRSVADARAALGDARRVVRLALLAA